MSSCSSRCLVMSGMTRARARLVVDVDYDPNITDPDTIASYLDLVIDAGLESLDQCGPIAFGPVTVQVPEDLDGPEHCPGCVADHLPNR